MFWDRTKTAECYGYKKPSPPNLVQNGWTVDENGHADRWSEGRTVERVRLLCNEDFICIGPNIQKRIITMKNNNSSSNDSQDLYYLQIISHFFPALKNLFLKIQ